MTEAKSTQPQLPRKDGESWFDYLQRATDFEVIEHIEKLEAENESLKAELEHARTQIAQGDGSCDHCGRVPAIVMSTSLCNDCIDGVKRAEKAEAERDQALEVIRGYRRIHSGYCHLRVTGLLHKTEIDDRCSTCIKADALLNKPEDGFRG